MTTSAELRQRCLDSGRKGLLCYFQPVSKCSKLDKGAAAGSSGSAPTFDKHFELGPAFHLDDHLDKIMRLTGLRSELLVMGTLVSWVMRPQPELSEAIFLYGAQAGFNVPGARHRRVAIHVRKGDKHSLYAKHMRNHSWRVSASSFDAWGRRVAADLGAERALYMTDDRGVMDALTASHGGDGFFNLVPAPRECLPSYGAGVFGKHHIPAAVNLAKMHSPRAMRQASERAGNNTAICGPSYLNDDGIQLFAGVALLGQCGSFIGTQISNVDAASIELQATLHHPPAVFDVLNDVHRACLSDEQVWFGGVHAHVRALHKDRLARGDGNFTHGDC